MHLPKCGGTTLRRLLERQYAPGERLKAYPTLQSNLAVRAGRNVLPPALESVPPTQRRAFRLISGHYVFGVHEAIPGARCAYLSFVRDPVERVISLYYHAKQHADHAMNRGIHEHGLSLAEMLARGMNALEFENSQTRHLAGMPLDEFMAADPAVVLERAKRNIDEHFVMVGVLERFDESVVLAAKRLGWHGVYYSVGNVTARPTVRPEDAAEVRRRIRERNRLDLELYEHVLSRLDDELREIGLEAPLRLAALRTRNLLVPLYGRIRRLPTALRGRVANAWR